MKSLIITGPESTGKTTIAEYLSDSLDIPLIEEHSRTYLEATQGKYGYNDLESMAKEASSIISRIESPKLILDTDIITYKIWSETKFEKCSEWIQKNVENINRNLYLLCYPDIAWESDPLRESQYDRNDLFRKYEQQLIIKKLPYFIISGNNKVRLKTALDLATDYFL